MVEKEGDDSNISLQVWGLGLSGIHNNPQLLAYYTTKTTGGNNDTPSAIDTDSQGIPGASKGGARGKESIQH